jgi:hypothetical protein
MEQLGLQQLYLVVVSGSAVGDNFSIVAKPNPFLNLNLNSSPACTSMKSQVLLKMLVVMEADQQWVKYGRSAVAGRPPALSPLQALLLALTSPSVVCKAPCHLPLRQSASSCF